MRKNIKFSASLLFSSIAMNSQALSGMVIKFCAIGIAFVASLVYARALGAEEYGYYALVLSWMLLIQLVCGLGLNEYLVRETARQGSTFACHSLLHWAQKKVVLVFFLVVPLIIIFINVISLSEPYITLVPVALSLPFLNCLTGLRVAVLRAKGEMFKAQITQFLLAPVIMIFLLLFLWILLGGLNAFTVLYSMIISGVLAFVFSDLSCRKVVTYSKLEIVQGKVRDAIPFMLLSGIYFLNTRVDQIVIGFYLNSESVGIYAISARVAEVVSFAALGFDFVLAPKVARLWKGGDHLLLQKIIRSSSRWVCVLAFVLSFPFLLFSEQIIGMAFGEEFVLGASVLIWLIVGHLLRFLCGPGALILNMADYPGLTGRVLFAGAVLNLVLNFILIPVYGVEGAAIATALSAFVVSLTTAALVKLKLKLYSTPFFIQVR
ncbi:flippase [Zhongshania sp.]|uniref:flippase n=1 Tax=Zhongshania sp. TaxID=1971902 RepID=UPI001B4E7451|nr:flippase [Zhongshania sp.]MBQ0797305.1 flippase [Zhongshania sp.]